LRRHPRGQRRGEHVDICIGFEALCKVAAMPDLRQMQITLPYALDIRTLKGRAASPRAA
jgi:hypothetical protein